MSEKWTRPFSSMIFYLSRFRYPYIQKVRFGANMYEMCVFLKGRNKKTAFQLKNLKKSEKQNFRADVANES